MGFDLMGLGFSKSRCLFFMLSPSLLGFSLKIMTTERSLSRQWSTTPGTTPGPAPRPQLRARLERVRFLAFHGFFPFFFSSSPRL